MARPSSQTETAVDVNDRCEFTKQAVADSRQGVVLQLWLARGTGAHTTG